MQKYQSEKSLANLASALVKLFGRNVPSEPFARILASALENGAISYEEVSRLAGPAAEDLIFDAWDAKLLIPRRSAACGEWDYRLLVMGPNEIYDMPNIGCYLVDMAMTHGQWAVDDAVAALYHDMGEPEWERMPIFVRQLFRQADQLVVTAAGINAACRIAGLYHRTGTMILELKGGGIISPKLAVKSLVAKKRMPIYELNPGLFPHQYFG